MAQGKLIDVAIREFGRQGPEGVSTRAIAAAAGTAMSAITYHFGSKDGLYLAAADHIAEMMIRDMGPVLASEMFVGSGDAEAARAGIHRILSRLVEKMAGEQHADAALFVAREQMRPSEAFDRLYARHMEEMLRTLVHLVCAATGLRDERRSQHVTMTLLGQVYALRGSRAMYLHLLGTEAFTDADREAIGRQIAANTDAILDRLIVEVKALG